MQGSCGGHAPHRKPIPRVRRSVSACRQNPQYNIYIHRKKRKKEKEKDRTRLIERKNRKKEMDNERKIERKIERKGWILKDRYKGK